MRYLSLFSGIEAASVAWKGLGWHLVAFSEIEPFPCAVLKHHYPDVPNLGDITRINGYKYHGAVDLVVGGSPCQNFSIANRERQGIDGERSGLVREFIRLLSEVRPQWFIWENVPGALSTNGGRDFGQILREMDQCGYGLAWRILDAQFLGVPQRRRRVFIVGYFGDWRPPATVLFESEGLRRDIEADQKKRQGNSQSFERGTGESGATNKTATLTARNARGSYDDNMASGNMCIPVYCPPIVRQAITCKYAKGTSGPAGDEHHNLIVQNSKVVGTLKSDGTGSLNASSFTNELDFAILSSQQGRASMSGHVCPSLTEAAGTSGNNQPVLFQKGLRVRKLTVTECERLMGFPDGYTNIAYREKPASDSVRYKALGNSMVTNVMRWLGERINSIDRRLKDGRE